MGTGRRTPLTPEEARALARSDRCIGCMGPLTRRTRGGPVETGLGGLWCDDCWDRIDADPFTIPDLLDGGKALRADA